MQIYKWTQEYFENIYNYPEKYSGYEPKGMFRLLDDIAENAEIMDIGLVFSQNKYKQLLKSSQDYLLDLPLVGLNIIEHGDDKILTNCITLYFVNTSNYFMKPHSRIQY